MRYFAEEMQIECFRKLQNINIKLGKSITVFSGINGVGKSNIMSLIAMAFGTSGSRIAEGKFFPHFDEYFVITKEEFEAQNHSDESKYRAHLKIRTEDNNIIQKRLGLKDDSDDGRGIRVLPRATNYFTKNKTVSEVINETKEKYGVGDSGRIPIPIIFISLSRLFPMGETELDEKIISDSNNIVKHGIIEKYVEWYNAVLPNSIDPQICKSSRIKKIVNKNGRIHVELINSDARTQSVGEDNLGTIISALVDFYYLKISNEQSYQGGIICIDEIDASLHPSAQIRLLNLLDELSEELKLQVFLTTHSMTLLEEIINKSNRNSNKYQLVYILDPKFPRIRENLKSIDEIKFDMYEEDNYYQPEIKVYCEDEETEFIFTQLIRALSKQEDFRLPQHKVFPMSLGHNQLENLRDFDRYFENVVMLVDGDAKRDGRENLLNKYLSDDIVDLPARELKENILSLPTQLAPESFYYYILSDIKEDRNFWQKIEKLKLEKNYTAHRLEIILNKVKFDENNNISNDNIKKIFKEDNELDKIKSFIDDAQVLTYFYEKNPDELKEFRGELLRIFNIVDKKIKASMQ